MSNHGFLGVDFEGENRRTKLRSTLEGQSVLKKITHQRKVEVADDKVLAAKEKKKAQGAKAPAKKSKSSLKNPKNSDTGVSPSCKIVRSFGSLLKSLLISLFSIMSMCTKRRWKKGKKKEGTLEIEPFVNMVDKSLETNRQDLFVDHSKVDGASPPIENPRGNASKAEGVFMTPLREVLTGRSCKEGESFRVIYAPQWTLLSRCRVDASMWCREMMIDHVDVLQWFDTLYEDYPTLDETHKECSRIAQRLWVTEQQLA
nr:hypothetical protein [Tanacetum cinerariifolium]